MFRCFGLFTICFVDCSYAWANLVVPLKSRNRFLGILAVLQIQIVQTRRGWQLKQSVRTQEVD